MGTRQLGQAGEELAVQHLRAMGWTVLDRNWRCRAGELDIVALEPGEPAVLVFCEVKCRRGLGYGPPLESITAAKVAKLRELALHWLRSQERVFGRLRFDGIGVLVPVSGPPLVSHVRGIGS